MSDDFERDETRRDAAEAPDAPKKPWGTPRLTTYGDLRRITTAKLGAKGDGKGVPATKF